MPHAIDLGSHHYRQGLGQLDLDRVQSSAAQAKGRGSSGNEELKKVCRDFEAIFLNMMLSEMRETIPENDLVDGGLREEFMWNEFDRRLSERLAHGQGIGLAGKLYSQLNPDL